MAFFDAAMRYNLRAAERALGGKTLPEALEAAIPHVRNSLENFNRGVDLVQPLHAADIDVERWRAGKRRTPWTISEKALERIK